jgi:isopenicillin N synthase-like dioxygenase
MTSHPEPRIPVIGVTSLRTRAIDERAVVREIGDACRGIGFFYITGHGIAPETLARVFLLSRQFFTAPASLKNQARFSGPAANRGFISFGGETLDPGKPPDLKEAFNIGSSLPLMIPICLPESPSARAISGPTFRNFVRPCWTISIARGR